MIETEKNELLKLSESLGEVALDNFLKDGLFKDIPVLGTGISIMNLLNSISDRILLSKLILFVNELKLKNAQEIEEFKTQYLKNEDYNKIGAKILLFLDRADTDIKITWLANSLRLFVDNILTQNEFLRLTSIINMCFVEDASQIIIFNKRMKITSQNDLIDGYVLDHLYSIGLIESHGFDEGNSDGKNAGNIYVLNKFGRIFLEKII